MCLIQLNLQKCAKTRTKTKYPNVARGAKSAVCIRSEYKQLKLEFSVHALLHSNKVREEARVSGG
jgi:hypothetical protein